MSSLRQRNRVYLKFSPSTLFSYTYLHSAPRPLLPDTKYFVLEPKNPRTASWKVLIYCCRYFAVSTTEEGLLWRWIWLGQGWTFRRPWHLDCMKVRVYIKNIYLSVHSHMLYIQISNYSFLPLTHCNPTLAFLCPHAH